MQVSTTRYYVLFLLAVLACIAAAHFLWQRATCESEGFRYQCFLERTYAIAERHGIAAAIPYATDVVFPRTGYWQVHSLMHVLGEKAYEEEQDIFKTLVYLQPYADYTSEPEFLGGFDGFVHGAVTAFFDDSTDGRSYEERMSYVCEGESAIANITTNTFGCYHSLGHALMYANGNRIDEAVRLCDTAPSEKAREGCYYGAFMENSFLFWPEYHAGIPRPDAEGVSLTPVCERFTGAQARECHKFVGQTHLTIGFSSGENAGTMLEAITECEKLPRDQELCIRRIAALFLPPFVQGDETPASICEKYFMGEHQDICVDALRNGLTLGFGASERRKSPLPTRILTIIRAALE